MDTAYFREGGEREREGGRKGGREGGREGDLWCFLKHFPELVSFLLHEGVRVFLEQSLLLAHFQQLSQVPAMVLPQLLSGIVPRGVGTPNLQHTHRHSHTQSHTHTHIHRQTESAYG